MAPRTITTSTIKHRRFPVSQARSIYGIAAEQSVLVGHHPVQMRPTVKKRATSLSIYGVPIRPERAQRLGNSLTAKEYCRKSSVRFDPVAPLFKYCGRGTKARAPARRGGGNSSRPPSEFVSQSNLGDGRGMVTVCFTTPICEGVVHFLRLRVEQLLGATKPMIRPFSSATEISFVFSNLKVSLPPREKRA